MQNKKGTYALILALDKDAPIAVGKLGVFSFPAGYYLYVGSGLNGLFSRISRHVRGVKKIHWHIDYLMQKARATEVWYIVSEHRLECVWAQAAANMPRALVAIAGFGSSDCNCHSHLVYFSSKPSFETFCRILGDKGSDLVRKPLQ